MSNGVDTLTRELLADMVWNSQGVVFVDVWGQRCAPCLALSPTYEDLASEYARRGTFLKLEAPPNRMACVDLGVMSLPTFLAFKDGSEIGRLTGEDIAPSTLTQFVADVLDTTETERRSTNE